MEHDEAEASRVSESGCVYCQPERYRAERELADSADSLQQDQIDSLRRKCKVDLKKTKDKH